MLIHSHPSKLTLLDWLEHIPSIERERERERDDTVYYVEPALNNSHYSLLHNGN